jgi:hypothetical protein
MPMRLREFFYLIGLKPSARIYGHAIQIIDLPKDGRVEFARWRNPRMPELVVRQSELDELRSFIAEGDVAVDVGAQTGDSTLPIALACGATGPGAGVRAEPPDLRDPGRQRQPQSGTRQHLARSLCRDAGRRSADL